VKCHFDEHMSSSQVSFEISVVVCMQYELSEEKLVYDYVSIIYIIILYILWESRVMMR